MRWLLPLWTIPVLLSTPLVANAAETSLPICVPDPTTERDAVAFLDNWVATARVVVAREPCPVAGPGRYVGRFEAKGRDVFFVLSTPSSGRLEKHIPWLQRLGTPLSDLLSAGRLSEFSVWIEALLAEDRLVSGWGGSGGGSDPVPEGRPRGPNVASETQRSAEGASGTGSATQVANRGNPGRPSPPGGQNRGGASKKTGPPTAGRGSREEPRVTRRTEPTEAPPRGPAIDPTQTSRSEGSPERDDPRQTEGTLPPGQNAGSGDPPVRMDGQPSPGNPEGQAHGSGGSTEHADSGPTEGSSPGQPGASGASTADGGAGLVEGSPQERARDRRRSVVPGHSRSSEPLGAGGASAHEDTPPDPSIVRNGDRLPGDSSAGPLEGTGRAAPGSTPPDGMEEETLSGPRSGDGLDIRVDESPERTPSVRVAAGAGYRLRGPDILQPEASLTVEIHGFRVRGSIQSPTPWNLGGLPLEVHSLSVEGGWGFLFHETNVWSIGGNLGLSVDRLELRPLYRTGVASLPSWDVGPLLGSHLGWRPPGTALAVRLSGAVLWMPAAPLTRVGEVGPRTRVNALGARLGLELSFPE